MKKVTIIMVTVIAAILALVILPLTSIYNQYNVYVSSDNGEEVDVNYLIIGSKYLIYNPETRRHRVMRIDNIDMGSVVQNITYSNSYSIGKGETQGQIEITSGQLRYAYQEFGQVYGLEKMSVISKSLLFILLAPTRRFDE